jgi:hypothetical protein
MKWFLFAFKRKILYLTIIIICKKNLGQSGHTDCKILTIKWEKQVFVGGVPRLLSMFWNSIKIRWIGLQYAKGHAVKIQSARFYKKQTSPWL